MNNYLKKIALLTLVVIVSAGLSGCEKESEEVRLDGEGVTKNSEEIENAIDTSNWKTLESVEYGFTVKYPKGWRINPGGKNIGTNTKKQIDLTSPNGNRIIFNVYHMDIMNGQPYKKIPFDKQLLELKDNQEMVDKYGETFRYFRGVYSMGLEGDELARDLPSRAERTEEDFYDENHIDIYIKDPLHQEEDLAIMKEILKSFQR